MDTVVVFFELGYIFNIIGMTILVRNIQKKRHIEGISYYTQLLFCISNFAKLIYFPHTVLWELWVCWFEFLATLVISALLMYYMVKYTSISPNREKNVFDYRLIIVISLVLGLISNWEKDTDFEWAQFGIRFSIILEAIGLLPQIRLMRMEKFVQKFMGFYLVAICLSRICRVFFWVFQIIDNSSGDTYYTLLLADSFYLCLTADFIYNFFKHRNTNVIPYN